MQDALHDFRIEDDKVVWLSFASGKDYRINPKDLAQYLQPQDLLRVQEAIRLRQQFIRRVLPPTGLVVFLSVMIGMLGFNSSLPGTLGGTYRTGCRDISAVADVYAPIGLHQTSKPAVFKAPHAPATATPATDQSQPSVVPTSKPSAATNDLAPTSVPVQPAPAVPSAPAVDTTSLNDAPSAVTTTLDPVVKSIVKPVKNLLPVTLPLGR